MAQAQSWWQPPRLHINLDTDEERRATWLELFYDLIYVAVISELAAGLNAHLTLSGLAAFVVLFIPVWWSWTGVTFYSDRFDTDNAGQRMLTLLQMVAIVGLAVGVHDGLGETAAGFALAYAATRAILILMYVRVGQHVPLARRLAQHYIAGFSLAAGLWLLSVFVPPPARFALWALGLVVDIGTAVLPRAARLQRDLAVDVSHLPERFGLFTIIVLGESVNAVVHGSGDHGLDLTGAVAVALGLLIAFSFWWIYFDNLDGSVIRQGSAGSYIWIYTHLPLVLALTATGVGIEHLLSAEHGATLSDPARWLVGGAVAGSLAAIGILDWVAGSSAATPGAGTRVGARFAGSVVVLVLALLGGALETDLLLALIAAVGVAQVAVDLYLRAHAAPRAPEAAGHAEPAS